MPISRIRFKMPSEPMQCPASPDFAAWLVELEPDTAARVTLYCLPPAGAGAATYRKLPGLLPGQIRVRRVQPPGRETRFREPPVRDHRPYVEAVTAAIVAEPDMPYALFGHSMGALLAFEIAHQVRARIGREPVHLFASAFHSPFAERPPPIHDLPHDEFVSQLRENFGGVPDAVLQHPEILEIMLPIVRADLAVVASYGRPAHAPLRCPVTALGGRDDRWVNEAQLGRWRDTTVGPFTVCIMPGGHFYLDHALDEVLTIVDRALCPEHGTCRP